LKIGLESVKFSFSQENADDCENPLIADCLELISGVSISQNQIPYAKICLTCLKEIEIAYKFRMKAIRADVRIRQMQGRKGITYCIDRCKVPDNNRLIIQIFLVPAEPGTRISKRQGLETVYMVDSDTIPNRAKDILRISEPFQVSYSPEPIIKQEPLDDPHLTINQGPTLMNYLSTQFNYLLARNQEIERKLNEQLEISRNNQKSQKSQGAGSSGAKKPSAKKRKRLEESETSEEEWEPSRNLPDFKSVKVEPGFEITEYSVENPNDPEKIYGTNPKFFYKHLPLKEKEQFLEFERNVSEFQAWRKMWTDMIAGFRCKKGVDKFISGMIRKLLDDSCTVHFRWTGYSRNPEENTVKIKDFKSIQILLTKAVELFPGSYWEQAENRLKSHFRDAKGRLRWKLKNRENQDDQEDEAGDEVVLVDYQVTHKFRDEEFSDDLFPLLDKETFMELEAQLKEDDQWKAQLGEFFKGYLKYKPGVTLKQFVQGNMKRVFADSLATKYTWTGYNKQVGFTNYQERMQEKEIIKILEPVTLKTYKDATIEEVTNEMRRFFMDAKSRINHKVKRDGGPLEKGADSDNDSKEDPEKEDLIRKVMENAIERKKLFENDKRPEGFPEWDCFPISSREVLLKFEEDLRDNSEWQEFLKAVFISNLQTKDRASAENFIKASFRRIMHDLAIYGLGWSGKTVTSIPKLRDFTSLKIILDLAAEMFSYVPISDNEEVAKRHCTQASSRYRTHAKSISTKLQTNFVDDCQL
jgi:hypothetical protein